MLLTCYIQHVTSKFELGLMMEKHNWQNCLGKALLGALETVRINEDEIIVDSRPPFYGKYRYNIHVDNKTGLMELPINIPNWVTEYEHRVLSHPTTNTIIFGDDPIFFQRLIDWIHNDDLNLLEVHIILPTWWSERLRPKKKTGLFYNEYQYRIKAMIPRYDIDVLDDLPETIKVVKSLKGPEYEVYCYCDINDLFHITMTFDHKWIVGRKEK